MSEFVMIGGVPMSTLSPQQSKEADALAMRVDKLVKGSAPIVAVEALIRWLANQTACSFPDPDQAKTVVEQVSQNYRDMVDVYRKATLN